MITKYRVSNGVTLWQKREKSENKSDAIEDYPLKATYNIF